MSEPVVEHSQSEDNILLERGYKLLKQLGAGSYAKVYLTEFQADKSPNKKELLACKIVDTSKAPKDFVRKFLPRELDILTKLNHPHITHVHSIFQRRSKYFIFMRFAENGDLLDFILKYGAVAENQARLWLRQMALGIQYLHEMDIAHRDLKCENVLITENFNIKLADFGFARYVTDNSGKRVLSETYCGSLSYAAPEILRGSPYNPKISDVWSLGVIVYIMLNKAMPFDDTKIKKLHEQQMNRKWKFRAKVEGLLSDQVKVMVTNMLEPDVTRRWRLADIVCCDWIAMEPRLLKLTEGERTALMSATEERKIRQQEISEEVRKATGMEDKSKSKAQARQARNKTAMSAKPPAKHEEMSIAAAASAAAQGLENLNIIKDAGSAVHGNASEQLQFMAGNLKLPSKVPVGNSDKAGDQNDLPRGLD